MSKFFSVGMTLPQIIDCVTRKAAEGLRLKRKGRTEPGYDADLTLFTLAMRCARWMIQRVKAYWAINILCRWRRSLPDSGRLPMKGKQIMSSIYEKYGLKQVINASGRMTILGFHAVGGCGGYGKIWPESLF